MPSYNSNCSKPNELASLFGKCLANQTFCKLSNQYQTFEPLAQFLPRWYQTFAFAKTLNMLYLN